MYSALYSWFDRRFIDHSYSCRPDKGTHKALKTFRKLSYKVSKNRTRQAWILKCDVRKFFASIDQYTLIRILESHIEDKNTLLLLSQVIKSFHSVREFIGLPLGNLTSQLLVNIYMNEFDQFTKHKIKARHYIRYADDFVIMSDDKEWLEYILIEINEFLLDRLKLQPHPDKIFIKTLASGVDFLGWVNFPDHKVLRTTTKKRMFKNLKNNPEKEVVQSYLGLLSHGNTNKLKELVMKTSS